MLPSKRSDVWPVHPATSASTNVSGSAAKLALQAAAPKVAGRSSIPKVAFKPTSTTPRNPISGSARPKSRQSQVHASLPPAPQVLDAKGKGRAESIDVNSDGEEEVEDEDEDELDEDDRPASELIKIKQEIVETSLNSLNFEASEQDEHRRSRRLIGKPSKTEKYKSAEYLESDSDDSEYRDEQTEAPDVEVIPRPVDADILALATEAKYRPSGDGYNPACRRCQSRDFSCLKMVGPRLYACFFCHHAKVCCSNAAPARKKATAERKIAQRESRSRAANRKRESKTPAPPRKQKAAAAATKARSTRQTGNVAYEERIQRLEDEVEKLKKERDKILRQHVEERRRARVEWKTLLDTLESSNLQTRVSIAESKALMRLEMRQQEERMWIAQWGGAGEAPVVHRRWYLGERPNRDAVPMSEEILRRAFEGLDSDPPSPEATPHTGSSSGDVSVKGQTVLTAGPIARAIPTKGPILVAPSAISTSTSMEESATSIPSLTAESVAPAPLSPSRVGPAIAILSAGATSTPAPASAPPLSSSEQSPNPSPLQLAAMGTSSATKSISSSGAEAQLRPTVPLPPVSVVRQSPVTAPSSVSQALPSPAGVPTIGNENLATHTSDASVAPVTQIPSADRAPSTTPAEGNITPMEIDVLHPGEEDRCQGPGELEKTSAIAGDTTTASSALGTIVRHAVGVTSPIVNDGEFPLLPAFELAGAAANSTAPESTTDTPIQPLLPTSSPLSTIPEESSLTISESSQVVADSGIPSQRPTFLAQLEKAPTAETIRPPRSFHPPQSKAGASGTTIRGGSVPATPQRQKRKNSAPPSRESKRVRKLTPDYPDGI
ncbi:hypothetical protein CVT26_005636 [Gymnopilus dilepis]|uniref:Uncharacterized protein n=1 Tax=Gymnopilus dilepis TaxID=231916 RepID=A0A409Y010_9AGAR|nr:hypothetical protein CVT26_005636 [Gymnopilus dilepis]